MKRVLEILALVAALLGAAFVVVAIGERSPGVAAVALVGFCVAIGAVVGYVLAPISDLEKILNKR